jgi:hypothetical protein
MRQIKYILIDDSGRKNREHHYSISSKGCVTESTDIRKAVKVIDRQVDPDGYNANSVVVRLGFRIQDSGSMKLETWNLKQRDALKSLLVELRKHFPEAMIFGIREIGDYFIKVSDEMNQLRLELSDMQ